MDGGVEEYWNDGQMIETFYWFTGWRGGHIE